MSERERERRERERERERERVINSSANIFKLFYQLNTRYYFLDQDPRSVLRKAAKCFLLQEIQLHHMSNVIVMIYVRSWSNVSQLKLDVKGYIRVTCYVLSDDNVNHVADTI